MFACVFFHGKVSIYVTLLFTLENKSLNLKSKVLCIQSVLNRLIEKSPPKKN